MSGTISTVLTSSYTLSVNPTTITETGGVEVNSGGRYENAIVGPSPAAWTVLNEGTVSATNGYGVVLNAGGTVTNSDHALIKGGTYTEYVNGNYYFSGAGIVVRGASGTVVNSGTIEDNHFDPLEAIASGIMLDAGGSVTNTAGGVIAGGDDGIGISTTADAMATVINAGVISGSYESGVAVGTGSVTNSKGGTITGFFGVSGGYGTVINAGTITGVKSGVVLDSGVVRNEAGGVIVGGVEIGRYLVKVVGETVVNAGSITMKGTASSNGSGHYYTGTGVSLLHGGRVINSAGGVIAGGGPAAEGILAGGTGVAVYGGAGTVVNAGSISGGVDGVVLASGYANRVVDEPGSVFNGIVDGGNLIGAPVASTLELAAGGRGTLDNLNIQFVDFSHIVVDQGANWLIEASGAIGSGQTLTDAGTLAYDGAPDLSGKIALDGGTLYQGSLTVTAGGVLSGSGSVVTLPDSGITVAPGGTLGGGSGTLVLEDLMDGSIAGAIAGNEVEFAGSSDDLGVSLAKGVHGSVHTIAVVDVSLYLEPGIGSFAFHGALDVTEGEIDLGANAATLAGSASFLGSGITAKIIGTSRLTLAGPTEMGGVAIEGGESLVNSGSVTESGAVTLDKSTSLSNAKGGTWDITSDTGIAPSGGTTGGIINAGTFEKTAGSGTSVIAADFVNNGTIIATSGTLDFTRGFINHGSIIENGGTVIIGPQTGPTLFNQYVAGIADGGAANVVAAVTPGASPTPVLAAPHPA